MRTVRVALRCSIPGLALLALAGPAQALEQAALDGLKQLFETDPAAGFVKAAQLSETLHAQDDLEGAMAVIAIAEPWDDKCMLQGRGLAPLVARATPTAERLGQWELLGRLWLLRVPAWANEFSTARPDQVTSDWYSRRSWMVMRLQFCLEQAERAWDRVGKGDEIRARLAAARLTIAALGDYVEEHRLRLLGPAYGRAAEGIERAAGEGRDAEAVGLLTQLLGDRQAAAQPVGYLPALISYACAFLSLDGGEALIRPIQEAMEAEERAGRECWRRADSLVEAAQSCWSGRDDAYRAAFYWGLAACPTPPGGTMAAFASKARAFGRDGEARALVVRFMQWLATSDHPGAPPATYCAGFIAPDTPAALRAALMLRDCRAWAICAQSERFYRAQYLGEHLAMTVSRAPADQQVAWGLDAADALVSVVADYPAPQDKVGALEAAARIYAGAGTPDLAARCRELAGALAASDPMALLQCALSSAHSFAAEGKWEDVKTVLGPAAADHPPSPELLQASVLLTEAHLRLGDAVGGDQWLVKSKKLVETLPLPAGERANHLVTLAGLCDFAAQVAEGGDQQ